jgi:catechol 2,3-dioxygenase-like lactoylglutathione lyase family enzyme
MSTVNEGFDHMTVVVEDLDAARRFFGLLGFKERLAVVASGEEIARGSWTGRPTT